MSSDGFPLEDFKINSRYSNVVKAKRSVANFAILARKQFLPGLVLVRESGIEGGEEDVGLPVGLLQLGLPLHVNLALVDRHFR